MGRTRRKRSRRKPRNFHICDNEPEIILLNSWLAKQGVRRNKKLLLAIFDDTGRGVLTNRKILAGEELMNLPLHTTINVTSILMDDIFCNIFLENKKQCILEYKKTISFQSLMAFYLTFLKVQGSKSKWYVYLMNLPKEYTVPYFLPNEIKNNLDPDILSVISKQKEIIDISFNILNEILKCNVSHDIAIKRLKEHFTLPMYEWAYFTVNTRCVYMDLTRVIDLKNLHNTILNLIYDSTKISLCPYLDMINHSPNARNETKLVVSKNIETVISVNNLNEDLFLDVRFSIFTKNNFDPYSQVFICYGDSHNLKLITEYGFFLPANDLDYVSFNLESIKAYLDSKSAKLSVDQISFINNHGLAKDLYIDIRGLSFNLSALLMVSRYYYKQNMDVSKLIYSAAICLKDTNLNDLIKPMVEEKIINIQHSISKLEKYGIVSVNLSNCVALMCQHVKILENFIKR